MKLIIKDKKNEYDIEIESSNIKVIDLKLEMQKKFGLDLKKIKLIYRGKALSNNETLISYQIIEGSKVVFLGVIEEDNLKNEKAPSELGKSVENDENNEKYLSQLHNLIQLGYEKEKAKNIINKCNGDINKIIEFLSNTKGEEEHNSNNTNNLNKSNEKIKQSTEEEEINLPKELKIYGIYMKILTLKDENIMNIILNKIKKNNPALLNQIKNYDQEFIKFLSKPITQEEIDIYKKNYNNAQSLLGEGNKVDKKDGKVEVVLTEKESEIINNLQKLGNFKIEDAIFAYLINDKDENKAANNLLIKKSFNFMNFDKK